MVDRKEFTKKTMRAAYARADGKCERCGLKLWGYSRPEYHHVLEAWLGGEATLANCRVLCRVCHDMETQGRRPEIDKTRRLADKRMGIGKRKSRLSSGKYKRKLDGSTVLR